MAAPLNHRQFFHGSASAFGPGDLIVPTARTGAAKNFTNSDSDRVHAVDDPYTAHMYAVHAANKSSDPDAEAHVYEVHLHDRGHDGNYPTGAAATVLRKLDPNPRNWPGAD